MAYDLLILNGTVVDGMNSPPMRADVAVTDGRIVAIEPDLSAEEAKQIIDASAQIVSPGFVDTHTHYDAQIHWDPTLDMSSQHGFTTFVAGNCGLSLAPVSPDSARYMVSALSKVEGIPLETLQQGVPFNWASFGELLDSLDGRVAVNIGFTVGHSALRAIVMGERCLSPDATPEDIEAMKELLRRSIEQGGLGFSSSYAETHTDLDRQPVASRCATHGELLALAQVLREYEGTKIEYAPNGNSTMDDETSQWVAELAVAAGRTLDFPIILDQNLSDDQVEGMFHAVDVARAAGGDVLAQVVGQTTSLYYNLHTGFLYEALPEPWPQLYSLPPEDRLQQFQDADVLDRLEAAAQIAVERGGNLSKPADFGALIVCNVVSSENEEFVGRKVGEIADELGRTPFRVAVEIAVRDNLRTLFEDRPPESKRDRASWERRVGYLRDDRGLISGTDAGAHYDVIDTYAQSSRLISTAVTRFQLMPIEEAVHRLTQIPAQVTGLKDRGVLKVGNYADIVVFDPDTIGTTATELIPDLPGGGSRLKCGNTGIDHVIVNGEVLYEHGKYTGSLSGTVLRSGKDTISTSRPSPH
jgi:N-acyl-D-aspartate/D-glutamate deacylase